MSTLLDTLAKQIADASSIEQGEEIEHFVSSCILICGVITLLVFML